ncbi:hypothetical protein JD844_021887 [Phrynosoma platyrhinos]|uniref:Uncharacterized protein n=1 Tax=Phrynosoma platyrhinos TaxID=52577 RepID=A0ABQ7SUE4_PHRPL|nr:hypothetical protein JD844_021887 [Phrynosoma platyrhinos]
MSLIKCTMTKFQCNVVRLLHELQDVFINIQQAESSHNNSYIGTRISSTSFCDYNPLYSAIQNLIARSVRSLCWLLLCFSNEILESCWFGFFITFFYNS